MGEMDNRNGLLRPLRSLMTLKEPASLFAEQYRVLYTRLLQIRKNRPLQANRITSAIQEEGKTTVAFNLAITLSKTFDVKTLLIEADIKKPSFHTVLTTSNGTGLTDVLAGRVKPASHLQFTFDGKLAILPVGHTKDETMGHFTPDRLSGVVEALREPFEFILVDSPPVLPLADMNILGEVVDGILFVVQAGRTPRSFVSRALSKLPASKLLGLVFNNFTTQAPFSYYYYTSYFQAKN